MDELYRKIGFKASPF